MERIIRKTVLLALLCSAPAFGVEQGDPAPAWQAATFDGATVAFPELLDDKPTVVVFWATWCGYCKAFMPYLKDIQADYGADRINVVAIAAAYAVEYIPGLMVIDRSGIVAYRRPWTDLPAGETVARFWSRQVRRTLDQLLE